jgi:hypothetical protein
LRPLQAVERPEMHHAHHKPESTSPAERNRERP